MKGSFIQMGANALGELCAGLEQEAENKEARGLSGHLPELKRQFADLLAGIDHYLSCDSSPES
jgi:hypothetical protein